MTLAPIESGKMAEFDMGGADPLRALEKAEAIVKWMAAKCQGPKYIVNISGKSYPKVDWWTTVGMSLGLFPVEVSNEQRPSQEEIAYLAVVEVRYGDHVITRASAICSSAEPLWRDSPEFAIRSMATTRATGKAFRLGLSGLAVMAGLEPTPAEEMTHRQEPDKAQHWCEKHQTTWFMRGNMRNYAHPIEGEPGKWCNEPKETPSDLSPSGAVSSPIAKGVPSSVILGDEAPTASTPSEPPMMALTYAQLRAEVEASGMTWDNFELEVLRCTWATFTKTKGASADVARNRWETWKAMQEKEV